MMDSNLRKGSIPAMEALMHGWSNLNVSDAQGESNDQAAPSMEDLIQRNVKIIEAHIWKVMEWREMLIQRHFLHSTGHFDAMSHENRSRANDQTECVDGKMMAASSSSHPCAPQAILSNNSKLRNDTPMLSLASLEFLEDDSMETQNIPEPARSELVLFISTLASMYKKVLYHNFEHASHVTACVDQLMTMLSAADSKPTQRKHSSAIQFSTKNGDSASLRSTLSSAGESVSSRGLVDDISTIPIVHLAIVFTALIHDAEHQGVGNKRLVDESDPLAIQYRGKSVAENNSFDVSIELLRQPQYRNLHDCIFGNAKVLMDQFPPEAKNSDLLRNKIQKDILGDRCLFHRISYDVIMATDISCPARLERGRMKWIEAFEAFEDESYSRDTCGTLRNHDENNNKVTPRRISFPPAMNPIKFKRRLSAPTEFIADPFPNNKIAPVRGRTQSWSRNMNNVGDETINCPLCVTLCKPYEVLSCASYLRLSSALEQIIQAADVAHTMQSWHVFLKWNEKLYNELWAAKNAGRGPDCSNQWFEGQISFFDAYIFPLAKRVKQCGVFGGLGNVFYDNACSNRERWILEGRDLCRQMHENASKTII